MEKLLTKEEISIILKSRVMNSNNKALLIMIINKYTG